MGLTFRREQGAHPAGRRTCQQLILTDSCNNSNNNTIRIYLTVPLSRCWFITSHESCFSHCNSTCTFYFCHQFTDEENECLLCSHQLQAQSFAGAFLASFSLLLVTRPSLAISQGPLLSVLTRLSPKHILESLHFPSWMSGL